MTSRKRKTASTEEYAVPAPSVKHRVEVALHDQVSGDGRFIKRNTIQYLRPASPTLAPDPSLLSSAGSIDFDTESFTAFPSAQEVERYLDQDDSEDVNEGNATLPGQPTFATLVRCGTPVHLDVLS